VPQSRQRPPTAVPPEPYRGTIVPWQTGQASASTTSASTGQLWHEPSSAPGAPGGHDLVDIQG